MPIEIHNWTDIEDDYNDTILLGNGSNISINDSFTYGSLKEHAIDNGLLTDDVQKLFDYFDTDDFELVLRLVWQANQVNKSLEIADDSTQVAYEHVRDCLIRAVREIHPEYSEVENQFSYIASYLSGFKTILSLNYDLTLYWIIMYSNRINDGHMFKDCFIYGDFDDEWEVFRSSRNRRDRNTSLVFYPHGSLVLARNNVEQETKLYSRAGTDLLRSILRSWRSENYVPLFVSEGTTEQKISSIHNSYYLNTVFREVLPSLTNSLVVFGWGFGEWQKGRTAKPFLFRNLFLWNC